MLELDWMQIRKLGNSKTREQFLWKPQGKKAIIGRKKMHTHIWRLQDIDGTVMDEAKETANGRLTCEISEGSGYIGK